MRCGLPPFTLCPRSSLRYRLSTLISSERIVGGYICSEVEAKTCGSKGLQHFDGVGSRDSWLARANWTSGVLIEEFHRECDFLKASKHLNIVEFIGVFKPSDRKESILVAEEL